MAATLKDWLGSFWEIVIHPSENTFMNEAQKAEGKTASAFGWLLFLAVFVHIQTYVVFKYVFPIHVIILTILLLPLVSFFLVFCLDTIYRKVFHRKKTYYDEFLYLWVVIFVVFHIFASLLASIPAVRDSYLSSALYLYPIVLLIVAVKSLTKLKVWQAIVTVVLSVILAVSFLICMPVFLFSLIGVVPGVL